MSVFEGPQQIRILRAVVIRNAILFYLKTRTPVNRAYTPKNMRLAAGQILGKTFRGGQLKKAADELTAWLETKKQQLETPDATA